jgi:hypothetical protein
MQIADFFCHSVWVWIALGSAAFFGFRGVLLTWELDRENERKRAEKEPWPLGERPRPEALVALANLIFQFWFNFAGGFVGWILTWLLWQSSPVDYGWKHLVIFIIAFAGITGNLPYLSTGIREALVGLARRIGGG